MKKILTLLLFALFFVLLFLQKDKIASNFYYLISSPCDRPITYRIGKVDSGYGLTKEQFLIKTEEASQIWNKTVNKNLFADDQQGTVIINLIYSERQSMVDKLNSLENNLNSGKKSINTLSVEYDNLQTDFKKRLEVFNVEVSNWNKMGGAPEDVFNRLKKQEEELKAEADKLNKMAAQLNLSAEKYNLNVSQFNQSAKNFNRAITAKPEVGLYNSAIPQIDIYLTSSPKELIHTLAHEMGHAIGLSHIDDPESIMYPLTSEIIKPDNQEISLLQIYCKQKNIDLLVERMKENLNELFKQLKTRKTLSI